MCGLVAAPELGDGTGIDMTRSEGDGWQGQDQPQDDGNQQFLHGASHSLKAVSSIHPGIDPGYFLSPGRFPAAFTTLRHANPPVPLLA